LKTTVHSNIDKGADIIIFYFTAKVAQNNQEKIKMNMCNLSKYLPKKGLTVGLSPFPRIFIVFIFYIINRKVLFESILIAANFI